jgi:hypothetical protein
VLPACAHGVRRRSPLGRIKMIIHQNRLQILPKTNTLETRKRKMINRSNMYLIGNVPSVAAHDSKVTLRMYCAYLGGPVF